MKIVLVTQWFDPEPGALRGLPLARWLAQRGHIVKVLTGFPNYPGGKVYPGYRIRPWQWQEVEGVSVLRVPLYPSHDSSPLGRVVNYGSFALSAATLGSVLIGGADVVYAYHPPATVAVPVAVLKALRRVPYIYHVADMWPESVVESGMIHGQLARRLAEAGLSWLCRQAYSYASAITVLSPGFKRFLIERGVTAEKIHVIYNWADEHVFYPSPKDEGLATELRLFGKFNVVYAGNLGAFQGLETVIRAARLVLCHPTIQVVFVGAGQKEDELKALAQATGVTNIRFLGRRDYWEMPRIYSMADVLLIHLKDLPFLSTTIPSKTQVSLASGRPILMAVRGDAAELVRKAGAGLTCEPENPEELAGCILQFYGMNQKEREAMAVRGREYYLREMALEVGARRTESLCQEVLSA